MVIKVNGRDVDWEKGMTVSSLLKKLDYIFPMIIVKINGNLVKKEDHDTAKIEDGDDVAAIHLIAGG